MSIQIKHCPDKNTLVDYLLGKLPDEMLNRCESHFAQCIDCEETIRGLNASDTFSQLAVQAVVDIEPDVDQHDQNAVTSLIDRLQNGSPGNRRPQFLDDRALEVTQLLEPAEDEMAIGQLAHYQIQQLIGAGSTGVVYQAVDQQLDRMVALKILRPSLGQPARERFMAEARSAAAIDHPNVITIYHVGVEGRLAYMAMQWLPGETLEDRLSRVTCLPEDEIRQMGVEIASGLNAAHEKNLIHRDIKPANIWLREESGQAIILDFGLARIADDDPQLTNTGMLAGTPNFMSPEQTRGQEVDGRSDLFSLGCLMYRAATGKLPFGSTGILATLQSIQNHLPSAPKSLNPNLSTDFSDLVMCLLEKQPVNRPENARHLITALEEPRSSWPFVASSASQQKQQVTSPSKTKSVTFWSRWVAVATLIGLLGVAGFMLGPQIVRIMTDQGQLVIHTKDKDVKVEILSNGEIVSVIDMKTQQKIDLKSGEYHIQIKGDQNSFQLNPEHVVMMRGGKQIVTITKIKTGSPDLDTGSREVAEESIEPPFVRPTESGFEVTDAELDVIQARKELVRAEAVLTHSSKLAKNEFITQAQLVEDRFAFDAAQLQLQKAGQALERAKVNQKQNAAWQKAVDQVLARKLEVLEENFQAVKMQYENGVASITDFKKAELDYLDGKLQLLQGDAVPVDTGSRNVPRDGTKSVDSAGTGPTYDERTFDQWLSVLKTDRKRETIRSGMKALGELSRDNPEMQEVAIAAITPLIRQHGSNLIGISDDEFTEEFNHFFGYFSPKRLIRFILDEIPGGSTQSRKQLTWFLMLGSVYEGRKEMMEAYHASLLDNLDEIVTALLNQLEKSTGEERKLLLNLLSISLRTCYFWGATETIVPAEIDSKIAELLSEKMNSTKDPDTAIMIAILLITYRYDSEKALSLVGGALSEGNCSDSSIDAAYESVKFIKPEFTGELVEPLIELYENEELCDRITNYRKGNRIGWPGVNRNELRSMIIKTLESFGSRAEKALVWLDKIADGDSPQKTDAQNTARSIRAALPK